MYHKKIYQFFLLVSLSTLTIIGCSNKVEETQVETPNSEQKKQPNIVVIITDDMGYSDLSFYGGEINTPNLDALRETGMMFTHFYSLPTCSPTRSVALSGVDNHQAGLGTMAEYLADDQKGKPGYEGYLNDKVVSIATLLKDAGYNTYMSGKWHLGKGEEGKGDLPSKRGFEQTFALLNGASDHYTDGGYEPFVNDKSTYTSNGEKTKLPDNFYSSDYYTDKLIEFIKNDRQENKPFFAYASYTSAHDPLQVPEEYTNKYLDKYKDGWDTIREQRFQRMKDLNLIPKDLELPPRWPKLKDWDEIQAWDSLTPEEQKYQAKTMAIYAGMIDNLDSNIGRLIAYLKEIDEYENTIFVFFSDNGAEGANRTAGPEYKERIEKEGIDNSYENIGKPKSFISLDKGWVQVSSTPLLWYKGRVSEGGIRVPAVFAYSKVIPANSRSDAFGSVLDLMPTLLDYAGVQHPGNNYNGRDIFPMQGKSLKPVLEGKQDRVYTDQDSVGFELFGYGNSALFQGDWKILRLIEPWGDGEWKLFNIRQDPRELTNLAQQYPERLKQMIALYEEYEKEKGVVTIDTITYPD